MRVGDSSFCRKFGVTEHAKTPYKTRGGKINLRQNDPFCRMLRRCVSGTQSALFSVRLASMCRHKQMRKGRDLWDRPRELGVSFGALPFPTLPGENPNLAERENEYEIQRR